MCRPGDIVEIYSAQAGYPKYHLCIEPDTGNEAAKFLFLNSEGGYEDEYVIPDRLIPFLPASPTGESVVSCNVIVRINQRQRWLFNARVLGQIDKTVAAGLRVHAEQCMSLPASDRHAVVNALDAYCAS